MPGPTLEAWEADLEYDGTLAAPMGLLGQRVSVMTSDNEGKPVIVARMERSYRSHDMTMPYLRDPKDAEAQFFYVGTDPSDDRTTGFMLRRGCFGGEDADPDLRIRFLQGGVLVDVSFEA